MDSDSDRPRTGYQPGSPRERLVSSVLSIGIIALVVLAFVFQAVVAPERAEQRRTVTFSVEAENPEKTARSTQARPKAPHVATRAKPQPASATPKPPITIQKQVERPDAEDGIPGFIQMSKADLAAADIGKMKGRAQGSDSNGKGTDSRTAYGPGEGPGGVRLYEADWYRRPTDAELATYMPQNGALEGWGLIACRTVERYHVEDCQILGESPRGSGFGRAVQNAAWQFLVKPPRIDNKPQVGEWVRIRIDYSVRKAAG
ncbi:hypothetical protein HNO88_000534 [Novosphingobium chloroacetimidivorans]|uniref:Energy transducer TonB n=1 Tax=Novosphingobium chloroacetimidivorans TaxID=1428314 RepID=A0A7W7NVL0_9SPHN|nr:hypothetical protein [Novosphingobium chloroacetimidivorans]MBB4857227.1 hypothetical protein [Novosphingobium chloroacetimidivorans]